MADESKNSEIVEFFQNSTVFLTGGTGFLGKLILYKLLSTCEVSRVYLLVRKKSSKSSTERIKELLEDQIFLQLKNNIPDCEDRVKLVEGDCSVENLGISVSDEETLRETVNFVVHCAAAMDMTGSFKKSVKINIRGTKNLVTLAKKMAKLKTFVFLSTFGAFWERDTIDEKLYESHLEYEDCLNLLKIDHVLPMDELSEERITGEKLTYYSLTKAASENIFVREKISVPVVIFRFGFAIPCLREPIPGWIGDFYGPSGAFALGLLNLAPAFYWTDTVDAAVEVTPADLVVNAVIAVTRHSYYEFKKNKTGNDEVLPFVCNYSNGKRENSLTLEEGLAYVRKEFNFRTGFYGNKMIFILWCILYGYIPALLANFCAALFGKKVRLFQMYNRVVVLNLKFMRANLCFDVNDENLQNCWKNLNDVDKRLFSFDLNEVNWDEYIPIASASVRKYLKMLVETNVKVRLAAFWLPKIRLGLSVLYCLLILYCIRWIYFWFD